MSDTPIDRYLADVGEPQRTTLETLRSRILEVIPHAEQGLSYGAPSFKVAGKTVAGFAAFKAHCSYLPHSGTVVEDLAAVLDGFETSKGSVKFATDDPLPAEIVRRLVEARMEELGIGPST